jgi:hypothetical protein
MASSWSNATKQAREAAGMRRKRKATEVPTDDDGAPPAQASEKAAKKSDSAPPAQASGKAAKKAAEMGEGWKPGGFETVVAEKAQSPAKNTRSSASSSTSSSSTSTSSSSSSSPP